MANPCDQKGRLGPCVSQVQVCRWTRTRAARMSGRRLALSSCPMLRLQLIHLRMECGGSTAVLNGNITGAGARIMPPAGTHRRYSNPSIGLWSGNLLACRGWVRVGGRSLMLTLPDLLQLE